MRLRIIVEDDDGNAIAETTREVAETVNEKGYKVLLHPMEDDLIVKLLDRAEDNINSWSNPRF
jgi:hypothetical protein